MTGAGATVSAIWTDFGGVLTPPIAQTMTSFCARNGIDQGALMAATARVASSFGTDDVMAPIDTPLIEEKDWIDRISAILVAEGHAPVRMDTIADAWFDGRPLDTAWARTLSEYRGSGLFVGMLSNMVPAWDAHWRRMLDPAEMFDDVLLSFEAGHRKPDPGIFALAAERAGAAADRCVLVDDIEANCAGARAAGWHAIHFTGAEEAAGRLADLVGRPVRKGNRL